MGKKKEKKKLSSQIAHDDSEDEVDDKLDAVQNVEANSKLKKGKKKKESDNWEDEVQDEIAMMTDGRDKPDQDNKDTEQKSKPQGKKGKKKRKEQDNWEDDVQDEIASIADSGFNAKNQTAAEEESKADNAEQKPKSQGKKGKKKKKEQDNWEDDVQDEIASIADVGFNAKNQTAAEEEESKADNSEQKTKSQGKKGKKKRKEQDNWEDDVQDEIASIADVGFNAKNQTAAEEESKADNAEQKPKSQGKKGKKKKKEQDNWEDEAQDEIAMMADGRDKPDQDSKDTEQKSKPQGKKGRKKKEQDNWEDDVQDEIASIADVGANAKNQTATEEESKADNAEQKPKSQGKKGKKKKKEQDNWEDDIDKALSEIAMMDNANAKPNQENKDSEQKSKPQGKKGKKKKKEQDNWEDDIDKALSEIAMMDDANTKPNQDNKQHGKKGKKKKQEQDDWEGDVQNEIAVITSTETSEATDKENDAVKTEAQPYQQEAEEIMKMEPLEPVEKPAQQPDAEPAEDNQEDDDDDEPAPSKKKKNKKKGGAENTKKKPSKAIRLMQEELRRRKEEEERHQREEDERIRKEEEDYQRRLQAVEDERLRIEKKKQEKKERILQQKREGTYFTRAQKEANKKRQAYLALLKSQGLPVPEKREPGEKTERPVYSKKKKQMKKDVAPPEQTSPLPEEEPRAETPKNEIEQKKESEDHLDDWEEMINDEKAEKNKIAPENEKKEEEEESDDSSLTEDESDEEQEDLTPREKAELRIKKLHEKNEQKRSTNNLRSPVICVMGHVDTGKTKILDKIRHSNVQDGEAGGITQQIGATNIPTSAIKEQTYMVKNMKDIRIPGLLVIDTPGHESFSNLRSRGSSNCDMAILVVDIMHGLEPQTIESINMLRKKKTPFVVALNKVDRIYDWQTSPGTDIVTTIKNQKKFTKDEFRKKTNETIAEFAEQGLNTKLFFENDDPDTWISMVPTSAHSGDGMGNLMALVVHNCQTLLAKRLSFSENLQCTVLEVKVIQGLGTTVDVILTNGRLKYGDRIVLAGVEGPIVTHVKALLMPQPLKELRVKNPYDKFTEVTAAQGVKILAKELDKALAGTSLLVARREDEIEILKDEVQAEVDQALRSIKLQERGVFVQASTLGSLEALLEFLKQSKIPYAGISIGPVHKRDIMKASVMLEHDDQWAVILAFDVKVEREAQEMADNLGVRIFTADIIYHLFDAFMQHREDLKKRKQDEFRHLAVFPCKFRIVPNCVFKSRDPIVIGVTIEAGQLRVGTPICIPSKEFLNVGIVASMEYNHKAVEVARKPQEICIKIDGSPGEAPKMVGRHFEETDLFTSKISRESIDLLKNWFRDDMQKSDWQLVIELKKLFEIM